MILGPGSEIAGFRLEELIGEGGMGVVYRARQLDLNRTVAIKLIRPERSGEREFNIRFQRESELAASIDHPNVIPIFQAGEVRGVAFLAMRFVAGTDLGRQLCDGGALTADHSVELISHVAAALDAARSAGLVHRDVKPANILLDTNDHVYLTDFGLTKRLSSKSAHTRTGMWIGSINYAAPEQIEGTSFDARVDVYSLGCVLCEALTGELPYDRDSDMSLMWAKVHQTLAFPAISGRSFPIGSMRSLAGLWPGIPMIVTNLRET